MNTPQLKNPTIFPQHRPHWPLPSVFRSYLSYLTGLCAYKILAFLAVIIIIIISGQAFGQPGLTDSTWIDGSPQALEIYSKLEKLESVEPLDSADSVVRLAPRAQLPPKIGAKRSFFAIDFAREREYSVEATLQAVGKFCYIFVEDSQWDKTVDISGTEMIRQAFDESTPAEALRGIYQIETEAFGLPPDEIDKDPKIYILIMDILDGFGGNRFIGGYFSPVNQRIGVFRHPELGIISRSNEVEMLYIDSQPLDIKSPRAKSVLAHEFQHLIHWGNDPNEEIWINEGCSEYATFLCGYKVESVKDFAASPRTPLVNWPRGSASEPRYYGASYLFMLYLHEHYGGVDAIATVAKERENGIPSINSALKKLRVLRKFEEVFSDWKVANLIDDVIFEAARYGYSAENIKLKLPSDINSYPFPKTNGQNTSWTTDYLSFSTNGSAGSKGDLQVNFFSDSASPFDLRLVHFLANKPVLVEQFQLNLSTGLGQTLIRNFGINVDRAVLAISPLPKPTLAQDSSYSVSAMFAGKISFATSLIPNPVHSRYFDILLIPNGELGAELPLISIFKNGSIIESQIPMQPVSDEKTYTYTLYLPIEELESKITWKISYQGEVLITEGVTPSEVIAKYKDNKDRNFSVNAKKGALGRFALGQNFPDPFNAETWIPFELKETSEVKIIIYDSAGNLIKNLNLGLKAAGAYSNRGSAAYWDGKNEFGEFVSSGVYFYQMIVRAGLKPAPTAIRRMMLLK